MAVRITVRSNEPAPGAVPAGARPGEPPFSLYLALYLAGFAILLALAFLDPESWMSMQDRGNFQLFQSVILAVPLIMALLMIRKTSDDERAFWVLVLGLTFFLFWRETDVDRQYFEVRAFSWSYLLKDKIPLHVKLLLGIPSIALTTLYASFVLRRFAPLLAKLKACVVPQTIFWSAITLSTLFLSQVWDRARYLEDTYGLKLSGVHDDSYVEEAMEMSGELALVFLVLTLRYLRSKKNGGKVQAQA